MGPQPGVWCWGLSLCLCVSLWGRLLQHLRGLCVPVTDSVWGSPCLRRGFVTVSLSGPEGRLPVGGALDEPPPPPPTAPASLADDHHAASLGPQGVQHSVPQGVTWGTTCPGEGGEMMAPCLCTVVIFGDLYPFSLALGRYVSGTCGGSHLLRKGRS